jgi:hypothetical protein
MLSIIVFLINPPSYVREMFPVCLSYILMQEFCVNKGGTGLLDLQSW